MPTALQNVVVMTSMTVCRSGTAAPAAIKPVAGQQVNADRRDQQWNEQRERHIDAVAGPDLLLKPGADRRGDARKDPVAEQLGPDPVRLGEHLGEQRLQHRGVIGDGVADRGVDRTDAGLEIGEPLWCLYGECRNMGDHRNDNPAWIELTDLPSGTG